MKITIEIDCTPDEARQFVGLPDVKPMQAAQVWAALPDGAAFQLVPGASHLTPGISGPE